MTEKYNLVTQELLLAGYTEEHYPDYVRLPGGVFGKSPLENIYGGFEYTQDFLSRKAFQTGCGLYVQASNCISDMDYMGVNWCYENDNVLIHCPSPTNISVAVPILLIMSKISSFFTVLHSSTTTKSYLSYGRLYAKRSNEKRRNF